MPPTRLDLAHQLGCISSTNSAVSHPPTRLDLIHQLGEISSTQVLLLYIRISCRREESVQLRLTNNTPHSGLFSVDLPVLQEDTVQKLAARLARLERGVKGNNPRDSVTDP
jgi:hypothetical protein